MQAGCLKIAVLRILSKEAQSGYGLMKKIEELMGKKPSPGSIYPLLKELRIKKFILAKQSNREIRYALTSAGRAHLATMMQQSHTFLHEMRQNISLMDRLFGGKSTTIVRIIERVKKGEAPFGIFTSEMVQLRDTALATADKKLTSQQQQRIVSLLHKTTEEMQRICKK